MTMQARVDHEQKGGDQRGPAKQRRTGGGPRPARHIPWPELFKHHESVLTGHLKMMDMVRKHCVEGTGNYDTAKTCVDRTHEMIRMFKQTVWNFVPPKDNIDRVPLGASSASTYPGYSPADHIYGEAAQEYGAVTAELKRKGIEMKLDPSGPQYVVGKNKKPRLSQEPEQELHAPVDPAARNTENKDMEGEPMEGVEQSISESQYFVIDPKPAPVADLGDIYKQKNKANDKAKRRVSFKEGEEALADVDDSGASKPKRAKVSATDSSITADVRTAVEEEDISAEVDARLKAKEEKRKRKEEKKRKRESADLTGNRHAGASTTAVDDATDAPPEKPRKKRPKEQHIITDTADISAKAIKDSKVKKSGKNKERADAGESAAEPSATPETGEPKKKKKKVTTISN